MSKVDTKECVYVLSSADGYKYKLVLNGSVARLSVRRIKHYLESSSGVRADNQQLVFNNQVLSNDAMTGAQLGLYDGAVLHMRLASDTRWEKETPAAGCDARYSGGSMSSSVAGLSQTRPSGPEYLSRNTSHTHRTEHNCRGDTCATERYTSLLRRPSSGSSATAGCSMGSAVEDTPVLSTSTPFADATRASSGHHASTAATSQSRERGNAEDAATVRVAQLEMENEGLRYENAQLHARLQSAERRAAEASTTWQYRREAERLAELLDNAEKAARDATAAAHERWRAEEEQLVGQLDELRAERRRLKDDQDRYQAEQRALVAEMEREAIALRERVADKDEKLQQLVQQVETLQKQMQERPDGNLPPARAYSDGRSPSLTADGALEQRVSQLLRRLSSALGVRPLALDLSNTCVLPVDEELSVLLTLDDVSGRLFLYATLLNHLPPRSHALRLYTRLLEGALLSKDMAGCGAVGISTESDGLILLSTSVDVMHADADALASVAPPFIESARYWLGVIAHELAT